MSSIEHILAVIAVSDLERAATWYEALFGRAADNRPMPTLLDWHTTDTGWVQVTTDPDRAGSSQINLAVDDLEAVKREMSARGLSPGETIRANKGVELSTIEDPDGNVVTLIGSLRVAD